MLVKISRSTLERNPIRKLVNSSIRGLKKKFLESIIDDALKSPNPDEILINAYFTICDQFREYTSTERNIVAYSEFFYFLYIKKKLEIELKELNIKFRDRDKNSLFIANYKGNKLIAASDIAINQRFTINLGNIRPDVIIGLQKEKEKIQSKFKN